MSKTFTKFHYYKTTLATIDSTLHHRTIYKAYDDNVYKVITSKSSPLFKQLSIKSIEYMSEDKIKKTYLKYE